MEKITKNMTIAKVLEMDKSLADIFMGFGMFCIFCHLSEEETIAQACEAHDVDMDLLLQKLNEELESKK